MAGRDGAPPGAAWLVVARQDSAWRDWARLRMVRHGKTKQGKARFFINVTKRKIFINYLGTIMAILNIEEAADFLRMSRRSLDDLVRAGKIPGARLVGRWVFSEQQLIEHVEKTALANKPKPPPPNDLPVHPSSRRKNAIPL